jgi:parallel beta-helix repeat protein
VGRNGRDVDIIGVGEAEVVGGSWTFLAVSPVNWSVRDLRIRDAHGTAVGMKTSSNLTVNGCRITGIVPQVVGTPAREWSVPICIAPASGAPDNPPRLFDGSGQFFGPPTDVSGQIDISDNHVDAGVCSIGILIARSSARCTVDGNTVRNGWVSSIMVIESPGDNTIARNTLKPGGGQWDVGIWLAAWGGYPIGNTNVTGNSVTCAAKAFMAIGYGNFVDWDEPAYPDAEHPVVTVSGNRAHMNGCDGAIVVLHGLVKETVWAKNRLWGSANAAFSIWDSDGLAGEGNVFQANNIAGVDLPSQGAHFFMDSGSSGNTVAGFSGVVIDLGTGNTIVGTGVDNRPMNGVVGQAIAEAVAKLHELQDL